LHEGDPADVVQPGVAFDPPLEAGRGHPGHRGRNALELPVDGRRQAGLERAQEHDGDDATDHGHQGDDRGGQPAADHGSVRNT
jgi:hypothetical protein